jgi:hypothetical protein
MYEDLITPKVSNKSLVKMNDQLTLHKNNILMHLKQERGDLVQFKL